MTTSIQTVKSAKSNPNTAQKTFTRLTNKIKILQAKLQRTETELDEALLYFQRDVLPTQAAMAQVLTKSTKLIYRHYKENKSFSKKDRFILKELLTLNIQKIFELSPHGTPDLEIRSIIEELEGVSYDTLISEEESQFKEDMQEMFQDLDLDVDLSDIDFNDTEDTIFRKVFEAMTEAKGDRNDFEEVEVSKPKTKRELQREMKEKELENLQKKGLGGIYKQLAKSLHPDLEQDPVQKSVKAELMKKLTSAYENNDLYTILSLEIEWMNRPENNQNNQTPQNNDQLKIYNSILKNQVEDLQERIDIVLLHPKYLPIQSFFSDDILEGKFSLIMMAQEMNQDLKHQEETLQELQSADAIKTLRSIIQCYPGA